MMKSETPLLKIQLTTTFEVHAVGAINAVESIYPLLWLEIRQWFWEMCPVLNLPFLGDRECWGSALNDNEPAMKNSIPFGTICPLCSLIRH